MKYKKILLLLFALFLLPPYEGGAQISKIGKQIIKKESKKEIKRVEKISAKKVVKTGTKGSVRSAAKSVTHSYSKKVLASMTKEVSEVFVKGGYREIKVSIRNVSKPLLVSSKFDPYLKIPRKYTGDFDPVKFHNGNPRFVRDGCETNLGRMKRGLAPLYKDPKNPRPADHGYSAFELHHGGQKANPDYFALMAEDHKTSYSVLHPKRTGSEINRQEFSQKERMPLYKDISEYIDLLL